MISRTVIQGELKLYLKGRRTFSPPKLSLLASNIPGQPYGHVLGTLSCELLLSYLDLSV